MGLFEQFTRSVRLNAGAVPAPRVDDEGARELPGDRDGVPTADRSGAWSGLSLPVKLLVLTVVFVMLAEVLIFLPSIANFRVNWLTQRLTSARLASLAADTAPKGQVPAMVKQELLDTAQVKGVAIKKNRMRRLVLPPTEPVIVHASFDLREKSGQSIWAAASARVGLISDALMVFFAADDRVIRVYGRAQAGLSKKAPSRDEFVEIVLPEAPLKRAMIQHALNILLLSIVISIIAAGLVYFALIRVLVQPMMDLTKNMLHFSGDPEDPRRIIEVSERRDEIGTAERELANMQKEMIGLLQQKNRLAQLGLAVSKINHDLRNMLGSAQLISDRLASLPDPTVQRFAPKLIASLDRAINFCNDTLKFGRAEEAPPRREIFALKSLFEEVGDGLDLPRPGISWDVDIDHSVQIDADRDHLYRVFNNICRNAAQALESQPGAGDGSITVSARREGLRTIVEINDDGPGIPPRARENMFRAFQGGARKGGSGLGLAISAELIRAHGGKLELIDTDVGASFRVEVPDRSA